jgi:hypothetical protein
MLTVPGSAARTRLALVSSIFTAVSFCGFGQRFTNQLAGGTGSVLQFYQIKLQKSNGRFWVKFDMFSPLKLAGNPSTDSVPA